MVTHIYHPMNRILNEVQCRVNQMHNMPHSLGEMAQRANAYMPKVNVELKNIVLVPRVDAVEDVQSYIIIAELPGVAKEDVSITIKERILTISGEKKRSDAPDNLQFIAKGRRFGKFERSFELPENAASEGITAECSNGLLTLTIPKVEVKEPETITVEIQ